MKQTFKPAGRVLKGFLWVDIGLTVLLMINLLVIGFTEPGEAFLNYDLIVSLALAIIVIIYTIIYLVWLYRVHNYLQYVDSSYPITPGGALARVMIPIYNLYGIWNVYSTMAKHFKKKPSIREIGVRLARYVPVYYLLFLTTAIFNSYLSRQPIEEFNTSLWFISYTADIALVIIYIMIIKIVTAGLLNFSKEENIDSGSNAHFS
ncbi:hypothetical protein FZC84_17730 [Rossellomorea vietnamensis]|uniref:DUF4328 domain-containing protein n=1 Tax=Rossellomorea vietnamensis TaxID=218284 RepID=A0A5D4M8U1_9BACI|nr:hypothetical protein [Rossellomorea vietnamensis]TYR97857.1 hypothetical protein FZC84_17730 [Rossellomorea vietnamensis]